MIDRRSTAATGKAISTIRRTPRCCRQRSSSGAKLRRVRGWRVAWCVAERTALKVPYPGDYEEHAEPSFIVQGANRAPSIGCCIRRGDEQLRLGSPDGHLC